MSAEIPLRIAGIDLALRTRDDAIAALVSSRYAGFIGSDAATAWRVGLAIGDGLGGSEDVRVRADGGIFLIDRHDFHGTVDSAERVVSLALASAQETTVDSALRVLMSLVLAAEGGLLVHAASVVRDERGYVFAGPSGSGKTTLARLARATLLSDELSIVRVRADQVSCHGTPFWGELARGGDNREAALAGFYRLRKAPTHRRRPLAKVAAIAALLENVMWFAHDPGAVARVLALAGAIIERVPCYELEFRRDAGFWTVIDDG